MSVEPTARAGPAPSRTARFLLLMAVLLAFGVLLAPCAIIAASSLFEFLQGLAVHGS